ncbi:hypothetical protein DAI22_03g283050 [Oryza sativa Japonica Group]|nr:hypothetical protein DAI22_03g283050 [Oryza sativa Japonica Group]
MASCGQWPVDLAADVVLITVEVVHGITVRISEVLLDIGLAVDLLAGHALDVGLLAAEHRAAPCGRARRPGARRPRGNPRSRKPPAARWRSAWPRPATAAHLPQLAGCPYSSPRCGDQQQQQLTKTGAEHRHRRFRGRPGSCSIASGRADVNYAGVVWLKARRVAEAALVRALLVSALPPALSPVSCSVLQLRAHYYGFANERVLPTHPPARCSHPPHPRTASSTTPLAGPSWRERESERGSDEGRIPSRLCHSGGSSSAAAQVAAAPNLAMSPRRILPAPPPRILFAYWVLPLRRRRVVPGCRLPAW